MLVDVEQVGNQKTFARLVGLSEGRVSQLMSDGLLLHGDTLGGWLLAYVGHLREMAAGRMAAGDLDLATERAALARAQRERIEMQNATTRRELAPVYLIEEVLAKAGARVAGILDAIPGQVRRRIPDIPASSLEIIRSEIARARNIAAAVRLEDLVTEEEPDQESNNA